MSGITWRELNSLISYNPDTGSLTWKVNGSNKVVVGDTAGSIHSDGYITVRVCGTAYLAHRIIWALHYKEKPPALIDHRNEDKTDNRIVNLRAATSGQNNHNRPKRKDNSSGHKGVTWHKGKWYVQVGLHGKKYSGGYHTDLTKAVEIATKLRIQLHGAYANHN